VTTPGPSIFRFGHLSQPLSPFEFLFKENDEFRDETNDLPCMVIIEQIYGDLVIMKVKAKESPSTRK
jgi:hypothetical protein